MRGFADPLSMIESEVPAGSVQIHLAHQPHFHLGALLIKPSLLEVSANGRRLMLERRVMQVLVALARSDGEVVTREELFAACWAGRIVGEDAINRCIFRLRRLAERFEGGYSIETVPRVGYRLIAAEAGQPATGPRPSVTVPAIRVVLALAAAALAICIGAALGEG